MQDTAAPVRESCRRREAISRGHSNPERGTMTRTREAFGLLAAVLLTGGAGAWGCAPASARTAVAAGQRARDLAAIERLHEADMRAVVAGDTATLMRLWTDDIVALPPGRPAAVGRAVNAQALRRDMERSAALEPIEYVLDFAAVEILGDHAVEWGTYRGRVRSRESGAIAAYGGKVMRVLRREADGSWRVARTMFTADAP